MKLFEKYDEYYKSNIEKIKKLIVDTDSEKFDLKFYTLDDEKHIVDVIDRNTSKLLLRCEYKVIGFFNIPNSSWTWVWDNPFIEKNLGIDKNKLFKLKKDLEDENVNQNELEEIIYYLDNPSFYFSFNNIDRILKFVMYHIEAQMILTRKENKNQTIIEFIAVTKILTVY